MTDLLLVNDKFPRKDFTSITQLGLKAHGLAITHAGEIGPRLPPDLVEGLSEDVTKLGADIPSARQTRNEARAATTHQNTALAEGHERVMAIRTALRKAKVDPDIRAAYGVGQGMDGRSVRDVKAGLQQIVDRVTAKPQEAAALGILPADVDALKAALLALTDADTLQEIKRASAPLSTKERNRTANRILAAVGRIEGAGRMAFAADEITRASFEALGVGPAKSKEKEPAKVASAKAASGKVASSKAASGKAASGKAAPTKAMPAPKQATRGRGKRKSAK